MKHDARKMSDMLKEMAEQLLRNPEGDISSEAMHVALMFANFAWNEAVGLNHAREGYRSAWEMIERENPDMWGEFKSRDVNAMIDDLVKYKNRHFAGDGRRILTCGIPNGNIHVEWLPPVEPGVDSKAEMHLYGLVRTGRRDEAIRFAQQTLKAPRKIAEEMVTMAAATFGMR
jgi:hypothetical protein